MRSCKRQENVLKVRINKIIRQLNGVAKMIEEDSPCEDVLMQLSAANGAMHKVGLMILEGHLPHFVRERIQKGDADETIENFAEALESFSRMN